MSHMHQLLKQRDPGAVPVLAQTYALVNRGRWLGQKLCARMAWTVHRVHSLLVTMFARLSQTSNRDSTKHDASFLAQKMPMPQMLIYTWPNASNAQLEFCA